MKDKVKSGLIFLAGLVSGAAGMFVFVKAKWQKEFEDKRNEMVQYFENKKPELEKKTEPDEETIETNSEDEEKAKGIIKQYNYAKVSSPERTKNASPILNDSDYKSEPYEIDSREFGSQEMYAMITLYLHDDGEVRTDTYEPVDDETLENYIGPNTLERIADLRETDPDMDSYYVRNDRLKIDCEILIESEGDEMRT